MSTHPSREKRPDKVDFGKMTPEEQRKYSLEQMNHEDQGPTTEVIAHEAKKELDQVRSRYVQ